MLFSPLQKASSYLVDKLDGFKGSFVSSSTYRDRISELESEVADYQSKLVDYEKLKKQVEAYEKFLEVKEKNPDFKFVAGTVIGRDSADTFGSFVLNCGSNDGVKVNDPVISGEYLIGIVNEVTPTSCVVLSVTDPKVNAAAYEIRTGEMGYTETNVKARSERPFEAHRAYKGHLRCGRRNSLHIGRRRNLSARPHYRHGDRRKQGGGQHLILCRGKARGCSRRCSGRFCHNRIRG